MPGFMGIRGLEPKNPHDMERERREEQRQPSSHEMEKRSREKVQDILRDQDGDMSGFTGSHAIYSSQGCCQLKVDEIMSGRVAVLSFDDTLLTVHGIFSSVKFRHLPVVDGEGRIIGIISDRDVLRMISPFYGTVNEQTRDKEIMARKVGVVMTRNPLCAGIETTVIDAVRLMNGNKISCLPIIDGKSRKLLGIVTWKDIVRAFCPKGFDSASDSHRLRTGIVINPESSESARLRAKTAESARLKASGSVPNSTPRRPDQPLPKTPPPARPTTPKERKGARSDTETIVKRQESSKTSIDAMRQVFPPFDSDRNEELSKNAADMQNRDDKTNAGSDTTKS